MCTDAQIDRCALFGGEFTRQLNTTFSSKVAASDAAHGVKREYSSPDTRRFLREYKTDKLWTFQPGRSHEGFKTVKLFFGISNSPKFSHTVSKLSDSVKTWQKFLEN